MKSIRKKPPRKKSTSKKATSKKATSKKATSKKAASKKATSKKATSKKATSKKATSKKATSKKATSKKATSKKATRKKATSKKNSSGAPPLKTTEESSKAYQISEPSPSISGIASSMALGLGRERILRWRNQRCIDIELAMRGGFPTLIEALRKEVDQNSHKLRHLLKRDFADTNLQPIIESWIDSIVRPELERVQQEVESGVAELRRHDRYSSAELSNRIQASDFLAPLSGYLLGGAAAAGAIIFGIKTVTVAFFWTTTVLNPVLLIPAVIAVIASGVFGTAKLGAIRKRVSRRIEKNFFPIIRDRLIGEGCEDEDGEDQPSMLDEIQEGYHQIAETLIQHVGGVKS